MVQHCAGWPHISQIFFNRKPLDLGIRTPSLVNLEQYGERGTPLSTGTGAFGGRDTLMESWAIFAGNGFEGGLLEAEADSYINRNLHSRLPCKHGRGVELR